MKTSALSFLALAAGLFLGACQKPAQNNSPSQLAPLHGFVTSNKITVYNHEGLPLKDAQVLIGTAENDPFSGNLLTTDSQGQITSPKKWTSPQPVTVNAPGFIKVTYLALAPGGARFELRPLMLTQQLELKGLASGLPIKNKDGFADFAMVMPALTRADMLSFDLSRIVSTQMDQMTAMGQSMDVPSNVSFPKQVESYLFFNITLDKPLYRLYFGQPGFNRIYALAGKFPFKSTADGLLAKKSFLQLLNNFDFNAGALRDIDLQAGSYNLDMPTQELRFDSRLNIQAPAIAPDESYLAVAVSHQSGFLVPTDVRLLKSQERMTLKLLNDQESFYLAALKKSADLATGEGDRLSAALLPTSSATQPELLAMIADPLLREGGLSLPGVSPISGVMPLGTKLVYSVEQEITQGKAKLKVFSPQWEIYSTQWETLVSLPDMSTAPSAERRRWEVKFIGGVGPSQITHGPAMIENASHVTQSSVIF